MGTNPRNYNVNTKMEKESIIAGGGFVVLLVSYITLFHFPETSAGLFAFFVGSALIFLAIALQEDKK